MKCPHCNGAGIVNIVWRGLPEAAGDVADCACCDGRGTVSADRLARIDAGRAMREDRMARGVSLAEEARRRGISRRAMSDMEWGRG